MGPGELLIGDVVVGPFEPRHDAPAALVDGQHRVGRAVSVRHGEVNADGALTIKRGDDARTTLRLGSTPIGDLLPLRQVG